MNSRRGSGFGSRGLARVLLLSSGMFIGGAALPGSARADDAKDKADAATFSLLEAQIKGHIAAKALDGLKKDVEDVAGAMKDQPDAKSRAKLGTLMGAIVNGTTDDDTQKVAIVAIGASKEPSLFMFIRRFLLQPNLDAEPPLCRTAIEAAGLLVADEGVLPLMTIVEKSHVLDLAAAAMNAFSLYGTRKNVRSRIVRDLVGTIEKNRPGVGNRWDGKDDPTPTARTRTGDQARQRWELLGASLVTTLNKMTGTACGSAEDWIKLYNDNRNGLDKLFVDPAK